jgi:hypothetical protein
MPTQNHLTESDPEKSLDPIAHVLALHQNIEISIYECFPYLIYRSSIIVGLSKVPTSQKGLPTKISFTKSRLYISHFHTKSNNICICVNRNYYPDTTGIPRCCNHFALLEY